MTPIARSSSGCRRAARPAAAAAERQHEVRDRGRVEKRLVAAGERRAHPLALHRRTPARRGADRAGEGREADQEGIVAVSLADELAEVELAAPRHLRPPGVADVGVVRPDDDPRAQRAAVEVGQQPLQGLGHVACREGSRTRRAPRTSSGSSARPRPRAGRSARRRTARPRRRPVAAQIRVAGPLQVDQLPEHLAVARLRQAGRDRVAVALALLEPLQARVALARPPARPSGSIRSRYSITASIER